MKRLRFLLYPFSILYNAITGLRNLCFNKRWMPSVSFDTSVIAVGNLSTGGTGKTPMIEYLVDQHKNKSIAVLSRGYGRKTNGYIEVNESHTADLVGDEPLQLKQKFKNHLTVAVCEDRVAGIHKLLEKRDFEYIFLDDAFQHRHVKAQHYILLTSYQEPYYADYLLPAGNLRESRGGARRADSIVVTKCPPDLTSKEMTAIENKINPLPTQQVYFSSIEYASFAHNEDQSINIDELMDKKILAITGIAKPQYFVEFLKQYGPVSHMKFADHYEYKKADFKNMSGYDLLITTEKDFVKLSRLGLENLFYLPIQTAFLGNALTIN